MKKHNAGFTLAELMIVMVIVALLSGSVLRGWQYWQQRQHLNESARQLLLFLQRLQNAAYWHNNARRLWWREQPRGCIGSGAPSLAVCRRGHDQFVPNRRKNWNIWLPCWLSICGGRVIAMVTARDGHLALPRAG